MNLRIYTTSFDASKAAIYSASVDEVAKILCFMLFQSTAPPFKMNTYQLQDLCRPHPSDIPLSVASTLSTHFVTPLGISYYGPTIPPTSTPLPKEAEREPEATKDKVQTINLGSTAYVQPPVIQVPIPEPDVAPKPNPKSSIPYPSRLNDQKLREKSNNQMLKFLKIFQRLHFDLSFADALLHMPKFASTFKSLLSNKEKIFELANTPKVSFLADFVVVDYDVDPWIPLILGRPFLRTARALIDVHGEEIILRDGDEQLIFHVDNTSKHPNKHGKESINMINFIDITCEDRFSEVLKFKKSNHPLSGSTTSFSDSLLEEFADELALLDPFPPGNKDDNFDPEVELRKIEYLLNQDLSTESSPKTDTSIAITPVLPTMEPEDSLIMGDENFSTIPEKESDEVIKSSVEDLVPIPSESEDTPDSDKECDLPFSVTFSNPLFDSNDDFTSSDEESIPKEDEIENKDTYVSNFDEPALLVTSHSDANEDECFDPGGDIDEINAFLDMDVSTDIEDDYYDSEGDIIYLESLFIEDTIPNLPPEVFLDHDPRSLKDEHDNDAVKSSSVKVYSPSVT
ncbi:hypothetical protein Tco_0610658 [Tanacetum coccineum]